jgi:tetratricopeptide (TPR) repeat protein
VQHRENKLRAGHPQVALSEIEADQENVRAAWDWAVEQGNVVGIDQAVNGLGFFYVFRDRLYDGLAISEAANNKLRQLPESHINQRVLAKTLIWHGRFMIYLGQIEAQTAIQEAMTLLEQAEQMSEDICAERAFALLTLGHISFEEGERQQALQQFEQSLGLYRQVGDQWGEFNTHNALGNAARRMGNYQEARHRYEKNLNLARSQHNQWEIMRALLQLGWVARDLVAYDEARRLFEECLALSRTQNNLWGESRALEALAFLALFQGAFAAAGRYLEQAHVIARDNGIRSDMVDDKVNIAVSQWLSGYLEEAEDALAEAKAIGTELGYPWATAYTTIFYGELMALTGRYEVARENIQQGMVSIQRRLANPFVGGRAYRVMGWLELVAEQYGEAQDWFEQSLEAFRAMGDDEAMAWTTAGLGHAFYGLGNYEKAQKIVVDALWTAVELQAYITLLFLIPITTLLLDHQKQDKWRDRLHTLACRVPLLAKAPFFAQLVWSQLPPLKKAPPVEEENLAELRRELWAAVSQLLAEDVLA